MSAPRASVSFSEAEINTLDQVFRGLLRGQDLSGLAKQSATTLESIARKTEGMKRNAKPATPRKVRTS